MKDKGGNDDPSFKDLVRRMDRRLKVPQRLKPALKCAGSGTHDKLILGDMDYRYKDVPH